MAELVVSFRGQLKRWFKPGFFGREEIVCSRRNQKKLLKVLVNENIFKKRQNMAQGISFKNPMVNRLHIMCNFWFHLLFPARIVCIVLQPRDVCH